MKICNGRMNRNGANLEPTDYNQNNQRSNDPVLSELKRILHDILEKITFRYRGIRLDGLTLEKYLCEWKHEVMNLQTNRVIQSGNVDVVVDFTSSLYPRYVLKISMIPINIAREIEFDIAI